MNSSVDQSQSTYVLPVRVPRHVGPRRLPREDFYAALWNDLGSKGLIGVHEGTVLTDSPDARLPSEWGGTGAGDVIDAGLAPASRDWVSSQGEEAAELYFSDETSASAARRYLADHWLPEESLGSVREQKPEDWDANWKASFKGVEVPPDWLILPPWEDVSGRKSRRLLRLNPGAGFGTGTHETTQLCLGALSSLGSLNGKRVLDFGSGSGILSVAAALLGASVDGIEIDSLAIENAEENAALNQVQGRIRYRMTLDELPGSQARYPVVIANILKSVLIPFAGELVRRFDAGSESAALILSGLTADDVREVRETYASLLPAELRCEEFSLGDWRSLVWRQ